VAAKLHLAKPLRAVDSRAVPTDDHTGKVYESISPHKAIQHRRANEPDPMAAYKNERMRADAGAPSPIARSKKGEDTSQDVGFGELSNCDKNANARDGYYDHGTVGRIRDVGNVPIGLSGKHSAIASRKSEAAIACAEYCRIPSLQSDDDKPASEHVVVVSTTDYMLSFWKVSNWEDLGKVDTIAIHRQMVWNTIGEVLFTRTDFGPAVQVWDIRERKKVHSLAEPTQTVSCICNVTRHGLLAAGSEDTFIYIWRIPPQAWTKEGAPVLAGVLKGHSGGVAGVEEDKYHGKLLSIGYDARRILIWDLFLQTIVCTVEGGRTPLVGFGVMPGIPNHIMTLDSIGVVRMWHASEANGSSEVQLSISSNNPSALFRGVCVTGPNDQLIAISDRFHVFRRGNGEESFPIPCRVLYSDATESFVVAADNDLYVYDAHTGNELAIENNVLPEPIVEMSFDNR